MKLSFSIMLLVAAAAHINAAVTPNAVKDCIAGSSGKGKGDGYKGYCCKTEADCLDDCVKGLCVGPAPPTKTTGAGSTTSAPTTVPTPGTCTPGSAGLGKGDGYKGYCCKSEADCLDDCVKGVCVGPVNTKTTSATTSAPTTVPTPGTCTPGSAGLGKGDGYKGYCCKSEADCLDDCVKGVCVGPVNTKTTSATTSAPTTVPTPGTCTPGSAGLGKGDGYKGYCCKSEADCLDDCVKGVCVGPVNTKTTSATTSAPTTVPTPGTCTPGSAGLGKGDGYKGYCCKSEADCLDDCVKGVCVGPVNTKTTTKTTSTKTTSGSTSPTPGACTPGSSGKKNGDGKLNACCKTSDDCQNSCINGSCNAP